MPSRPLLACLTLVAALTLARLEQARESLWLDELHTAWVARGPWHEVVQRSALGNQSPAYFLLEHAVMSAGGASEVALRAMSIGAGAALLALFFLVIRSWTGSPWLGVTGALLAALDPQYNYFATEARPYALVQCVSLGLMWLVADLPSQPTPSRRTAVVIGAALLFYLHYTAAVVLVPVAIWLLMQRSSRYGRTEMVTDACVLFALCAPAIGQLLDLFARRANWELFVEQRSFGAGVLMLPWAATAALATAAVTVIRLRQQGRFGVTEARIGLALLTVFLPVAIVWLLTASDVARLLHPRYLAAAAPAAILLLMLAIGHATQTRVRIAAGSAVVLAATATSACVRSVLADGRLTHWRTDDWRTAVAWFNGQPDHRIGKVWLRSLLIESDGVPSASVDSAMVAYTAYPLTSLYAIDVPSRSIAVLPRTIGRAWPQVDSIRRSGSAWVFFNGNAESAAAFEDRAMTQLAQRGIAWHVEARRWFGSVSVSRLVSDRPPLP